MKIRTTNRRASTRRNQSRVGTAAAELAICLPLIFLLLAGVWEVGRITEVHQVMWSSAREAARDSSLGDSDLLVITGNLTVYLQSAEPTAFGGGHTTSVRPPVVSLPADTTGYTVWDDTADRELFTITYTNLTDPSIADPTGARQLDRYEVGIQVPYASVGWVPVARITGATRLYTKVTWVSMVDAPFQIAPSLPAH
jgi:hypothetical protein